MLPHAGPVAARQGGARICSVGAGFTCNLENGALVRGRTGAEPGSRADWQRFDVSGLSAGGSRSVAEAEVGRPPLVSTAAGRRWRIFPPILG